MVQNDDGLQAEAAFLAPSSKDGALDAGSSKRRALESLISEIGDRMTPEGGKSVFRMPADRLFELLALYRKDASS